jgi:hypothetical protein
MNPVAVHAEKPTDHQMAFDSSLMLYDAGPAVPVFQFLHAGGTSPDSITARR